MLGFLYIILCMCTGCALCSFFFKNSSEYAIITKEDGSKLCLPEFMVKLPIWYLTGTLLMTWMVYLISYCFQKTEKPMLWGNLITFLLIGCGLVLLLVVKLKKNGGASSLFSKEQGKKLGNNLREFFVRDSYLYLCYVVIAYLFVSSLMFLTLCVSDGMLKVGYSVFSDFAPHLGMIRSFSVSNNFPTQYSHYAGEDVRYHFLFQFMVGNLEFLGMRIDYAFNLPSIFSMVCVYLLLFVLAVRLTKSRLCGYLTALFFTFRSSFSVFRFMAELPKGSVLKGLKEYTEFLGYTQNESWGLWNLNVYCNQRHLAFSLAILVFALIVFLPYLEEMGTHLASASRGKKIKTLFFTKTAFGIRDMKLAIGMGLVLGGIAFWNGSVMIATIAMLFFMAAFSEWRLDYLITAAITAVLAFSQQALFVEGSAVSPKYQFGFLAENKTAFGALQYIVELTGLALFVAIAGACLLKGTRRYLLFVYFVPFILAFTLALTIDITVNHKWIMMSLMLLSIFAAYLIAVLLKRKDWLKRVVALLLIVALTATGVYDYWTVYKRNKNYMQFDVNDPVTTWIAENATCDDMFLTPYYSLHRVVLGGAMLYYGWPYYAWSAGYDTDSRDREVRKMYEADTPEFLDYLIKKNNIRYIIVDHDCRTSGEYDVREEVIETTYEVVFEYDTNEWMTRIFDTTKRR